MGEQLYLDSNVKYCDLKDFNGSICNFQMSKYVKNGTWKWGNNFTLSPEKVSQVALFYTTINRPLQLLVPFEVTHERTPDEKEITNRTNNSIEKVVRPSRLAAQNADILRRLTIENE